MMNNDSSLWSGDGYTCTKAESGQLEDFSILLNPNNDFNDTTAIVHILPLKKKKKKRIKPILDQFLASQ